MRLLEIYKLKPDRADVINHAASICLDVVKSVGAKSSIVSKIGLTEWYSILRFERMYL